MGKIDDEVRGRTGELLPAASYDWWQEDLAKTFFGPDQSGRPVLFFVESQEPEAAAANGPRPALLGAATSALLNWYGNPYEPIFRRTMYWKKGPRDQPPPCLPLLASTVFAASQIRAHRGPGAPAYYARLAEVLRPGRQLDSGHRRLLEKHHETAQELWHELDDWLSEQGGRRGFSTIHRVSTTSFIDYAKSQTLIRMSDRSILADFFAGIPDASGKQGAWLLARLKRWNSSGRRLSTRLREALQGTADDAVLASLLEKLASATPAEVIGGSGLELIRPLIRAAEDLEEGWQLRWFVPTAETVHDVLLHRGGSFVLDAEEDGADRYALSGDLPDIADALAHGLSAVGESSEVRLPARHLLVLSVREGEVDLFEATALDPAEPFRLLFDTHGREAARRFFSAMGERWCPPDETSIPGWYLTDEIDSVDTERIDAALTATGLNLPRTRGGRRLRLVGGLRAQVHGSAARHSYLVGGEPDVCFAGSGHDPGEAILRQEANGRTWRLSVQAACLPLRDLELRAGSYRLDYEGQAVSFSLHSLHGIPSASDQEPPRDVSGADGRARVPLAGDVRFLDAQGKFHSPRRPEPPHWWTARSTGLERTAECLVDLPRDAVWLVVTPTGGDTLITLLHEREPEIRAVTEAARRYWTRLMFCSPQDPKHKRLWTRYRENFFSHAAETEFPRVRP